MELIYNNTYYTFSNNVLLEDEAANAAESSNKNAEKMLGMFAEYKKSNADLKNETSLSKNVKELLKKFNIDNVIENNSLQSASFDFKLSEIMINALSAMNQSLANIKLA